MTVSLVQSVAGAGATASVALSGVAAGSLLVAEVRIGPPFGATVTVSDSVNGAWTLAASKEQVSDVHTVYVFFFPNSAAGNPTITVSASTGTTRLNASEWAGVSDDPLGNTAGAQSGAGGPLDSGAITVSAGDLVFGAASNDGAASADWTAGGTTAGGSWVTAASYNEAQHRLYSQGVIATVSGSFSSFPTQAAFTGCTSVVVRFRAAPTDPAPAAAILDSFGGTLSGWTNPALNYGFPLAISGGNLIGDPGDTAGAAWTAAFTPGDLECYITLVNGIAGGTELGLDLADALINAHRYQMVFQGSGATGDYLVRRYSDDFTFTNILSGAHPVAAGDKVGFQRIGNDLNLWHYTGGAWHQFDTVTDATYSGMKHVGVKDYAGTNTYDDFAGGAIAAAAEASFLIPMRMI
jgi:hypothetical protein